MKRLWSSDEANVKTFTVGRTHMHANRAFTAAGTYRIGVEATVTVAGRQPTARAPAPGGARTRTSAGLPQQAYRCPPQEGAKLRWTD